MKVLGIGYGKNLFDSNNFEHQRLKRCAERIDFFGQVIFTKKNAGFSKQQFGERFYLHPTNSFQKIFMVYDAVRIGNRIIKEKQIDIVTTQDPFEAGLVGLILKFFHPNIKLQVQEHGDFLAQPYWRKEKFSNQVRYLLSLYILRKADVIRVVSERTRVFLERKLGANKKIHKLPVVIDVSKFSKNSNRQLYQKTIFEFVTFARFVPQKNFFLMLKAFARTYGKHPQVRLRIFGEGPQKKDMINLIQSLNISTVVEVNGWTDDVVEEMRRADAYLLTSNYEGWGRVLIEALLQALPVVTTDVGCVGEVIKHKQHGLVVPTNDLPSLVEAMSTIVTDRDLYAKLIENIETIKITDIPGTNVDAYAAQWVETLQ